MTFPFDQQIRVAVDVGCHRHRVAVAGPENRVLEEFDIEHNAQGIGAFFRRVEAHERRLELPVAVAMEGFNGWARPLDTQILVRGWRLFNVNNLKLARFKEIFPGPAKSDPIDTQKMLELFELRAHLPLAKDVLQEIAVAPVENEKLKRITRRRRQLVNERGRVINRLQSDLQAVSPGLGSITAKVDNLWFLRFLTCREQLDQLMRVQRRTVLNIQGIGQRYADIIQKWQKQAHFSAEVDYVGPMIVADARRILELKDQINVLETAIEGLLMQSAIARLVDTIPGYGVVCSAELAGEIGTIERFTSEASLALYLGMAPLDNKSGKYHGSKSPRQVNVRAKAAMMVGVDRHRKQVPESQRYYEKKRAEGKLHNQAIRALGRHLVRVIWSMIANNRDYQLKTKTD